MFDQSLRKLDECLRALDLRVAEIVLTPSTQVLGSENGYDVVGN